MTNLCSHSTSKTFKLFLQMLISFSITGFVTLSRLRCVLKMNSDSVHGQTYQTQRFRNTALSDFVPIWLSKLKWKTKPGRSSGNISKSGNMTLQVVMAKSITCSTYFWKFSPHFYPLTVPRVIFTHILTCESSRELCHGSLSLQQIHNA